MKKWLKTLHNLIMYTPKKKKSHNVYTTTFLKGFLTTFLMLYMNGLRDRCCISTLPRVFYTKNVMKTSQSSS